DFPKSGSFLSIHSSSNLSEAAHSRYVNPASGQRQAFKRKKVRYHGVLYFLRASLQQTTCIHACSISTKFTSSSKTEWSKRVSKSYHCPLFKLEVNVCVLEIQRLLI